MPKFDYPIDENRLLSLQLEPYTDQGLVRARLLSHYSPQSALVENILPLISIASGNNAFTPATAEFDIPVPANGEPISLKINKHIYADFSISNGEIEILDSPHKLSVFETRIIGRAPQIGVPYSHQDLRSIRTPITDLHTHLSGQVSAEDLLEIGRRHGVLYPTAALDKFGIDYPKNRLEMIPKRQFLPLAHLQNPKETTEPAVPLAALSEKALKTLQNSMSLSPESQSTFEDIEMCYYLREPFTKNLELLPEILRKVAENYKKQGIEYAELSSNAVIDPKWLKVIHDTLSGPDGIEQTTGVQLRFLVGLPRNLDEDTIKARIEQIKRVAKSPFIVGVDILGYEMNKTSHLEKHLAELAGWIHDHQPDMVLRIHAGENSKNYNNVKECLQLAQKHGIRIRVGHAVYGIDDETIVLAKQLAKKGQLIVEFNPDSNLAGNNIDFPHQIPILQFIHEGIPSALCSDGASLYLTSAKQTVMAGLFCGVTPDGLDFIHSTEQSYIAKQEKIFQEKQQRLPDNFFESLQAPAVKPAPAKPVPAQKSHHERQEPNDTSKGKRPIFIAGAAGSSWDLVKPDDKKELIIGLKLLLEHLDPDKVYFVTGRTKDSGVCMELGKAIEEYNTTHGKKFDYTLMVAESQNCSPSLPKGVSHKIELDVPLVFLPNAVLDYIKNRHGMAYFAGGKSFTRDFIVESIKQGVPCGLMEGINGASSEKAKIYTNNKFKGAVGMLKHAIQLHPEVFSSLPDNAHIEQSYGAYSTLTGRSRF